MFKIIYIVILTSLSCYIVIHDSIPLLMQYNIYSYSSDNSWESVYNSERSNDIWYWLNPHNCVFCIYIYLYIHMSNSASTSPFHPILSHLFQKDIQWLTYDVKVAIPTRFHDHLVSSSFLFSLTLSFSQPWGFWLAHAGAKGIKD